MEIAIGKGLDRFLFGISQSELVEFLGSADKIHLSDEDDPRLCYNNMRCDFWFRDDRLHWIVCASPELVLFGKRLHGTTRADVLSIARTELPEEPEFEEFHTFESAYFSDSCLELQFRYDVLDEVRFGHLFGEDDEPIWPTA